MSQISGLTNEVAQLQQALSSINNGTQVNTSPSSDGAIGGIDPVKKQIEIITAKYEDDIKALKLQYEKKVANDQI